MTDLRLFVIYGRDTEHDVGNVKLMEHAIKVVITQ